jgi:hypothetical protein
VNGLKPPPCNSQLVVMGQTKSVDGRKQGENEISGRSEGVLGVHSASCIQLRIYLEEVAAPV